MFVLRPLLCFLLASSSRRRRQRKGISASSRNLRSVSTDHRLVDTIAATDGVIWIDVENVRGKSGFQLSHMDILSQVESWMRYHKQKDDSGSSSLLGKVILVVDHGASHSGYWIPDRGMSIVFAGPHQKADDVLAKDVGIFANLPSIVVTADGELQQRCRRAMNGNGVYSDQQFLIMSPARFLDELAVASMEDTMDTMISTDDSSDNDDPKDAANQASQETDDDAISQLDPDMIKQLDRAITTGKLDQEIKLGGQLLEAESLIQDKDRYMTNKKRKKLEKRIESIRKKLNSKGPQVLERVTSLLSGGGDASFRASSSESDTKRQDALWLRWQHIRSTSNAKASHEKTADRIVLAERLRRHLVSSGEGTKQIDGNDRFSPAKLHVNVVNGYVDPNVIVDAVAERRKLMSIPVGDDDPTTDENEDNIGATLHALQEQDPDETLNELTVVVISDTHGYEGQFANRKGGDGSTILPDGDVLLHLGDFTLDEPFKSPRKGWIRFDNFLSKQPHRFKIVVRGNHDPHRLNFAQSGAWYVTKPVSNVNIGGHRLALIPHGSSRMLSASRGLPSSCDLLASHVPPRNILDLCLNGRKAGSGFLNRIVHSMVDPPRVWACGHIHEGRGVAETSFGAMSVKTTVINAANANPGRASCLTHGPVVLKLHSKSGKLEITQMDDDVIESGCKEHKVEALFAMDLLDNGDRTASIFNDRGELIQSSTIDKEKNGASLAEAIELSISSCQERRAETVTQVAISGAPEGFQESFARVAPHRNLLSLDVDDWRSEVFTSKELESQESFTRAMRLATKQVVSDCVGSSKEAGSGSIVLGMYAMVKLLGWITHAESNEVVRRESNGSGAIIVPKGFQ